MKAVMEREMISPKLAAEYLETQEQNRPQAFKRVDAISSAILRGEWLENGETVKFNGNGRLIDGQHRLAAIVKAGRSVPVWVIRGLPSGAQETVDIGSTRTVGNMLAIRGIQSANEIAGAARIIWTYRRAGELYPAGAILRAPTPQEIIALIDAEPTLPEWVRWGGTISRKDRSLRLSRTVIAAVGFIFSSVSTEQEAKAFFDQLLTPVNQTDATAVLRKRLQQQGFHTQIHPRVRLALVVKAWNAWVSGERPARLTWRAGGATKEEFPQILGIQE